MRRCRRRSPPSQPLWEPAGTYLNTASFGLPPRPAWDALQAALDDWRTGRTSWEQWGDSTEAARGSFARLVGVPPETVAVGATVSGLVGLVASSLPDGSRVLAPDVEFTSTLFPFLVQAHRGVAVRTVPAAELAGSIDGSTDVVAFSAVQMATGEVADLGAIAAAANVHGALTLVDATQACGWLPLDGHGFDVIVVAGYKWLLSPRGTAYMAVAPERLAADRPGRGRLVRRRGRARVVLRPAAAARDRRAATRHISRLAQLGRRRTRARAARGDRDRARSTRTTSGWPTASGPASGSSRATRRSCSSTCPAPQRASSGRGSVRPCAAGGCGRRGTCTTPPPTSTTRSRR